MSQRRKAHRKTTHRNHTPHMPSFLRQFSRKALWIGGILIVLLYIWAFYYFFVSPTGFRWRALYGEPNYPEGYDIHGIDISHYQGTIDWDELRNAMIKIGRASCRERV